MLAVSTLSPGFQALFFGLACLFFLVAAIADGRGERGWLVSFVPFGLALFSFVFFFNALALT